MSAADKTVLIYATAPDTGTAEAIGSALLDQRLAACINILPGVISLYDWQGQRQRDGEVVMIAKTKDALAARAVEAVRARHPYETPAVVVLPVTSGSQPFLDWIAAQTET